MSSGTKSTENAYLYGWDDENGRYSKHYYAGTQRMASRVEFMPQGMGEEPQQPSGQTEPQSQSEGIGESEGEASGQTGLTDGSGNANDGNTSGEKQPSKEEKEAMREYQKLQQMEVAKVDASGGSESASGTEESEAVEPDLYYYHTDHLGSTTFITDRSGDIAQYLAYIPYGETFIEERDVTPYKFNGKELDQETGYYYYGARYYDPGTALWLGVDPLQHKYPEVSPYVYCKSNPVCRIDPDGRADWQAVYDGSLSVVGGALSCIAGGTAACTPTGVGQVAGAVLISTGIVGMGLGTTQIIAGFVDIPNASNIPTGCVEAIGMVSDAVFNLDKCQTVGGYVDMGVGISATKAAGQSLNIVDILSITSSVVYDYSNIATFTKSNVSNNNQFICNPDKVRVKQPLIKEAVHQDEK